MLTLLGEQEETSGEGSLEGLETALQEIGMIGEDKKDEEKDEKVVPMFCFPGFGEVFADPRTFVKEAKEENFSQSASSADETQAAPKAKILPFTGQDGNERESSLPPLLHSEQQSRAASKEEVTPAEALKEGGGKIARADILKARNRKNRPRRRKRSFLSRNFERRKRPDGRVKARGRGKGAFSSGIGTGSGPKSQKRRNGFHREIAAGAVPGAQKLAQGNFADP